ncbi:MAG TPA: exosortase/archaeosortase family protein [Isosphaeraceae bacterium]|jgi:exosortase|nr:exosortase/archaeosortase family protein [Isosphaeraceae bacterium]
MTEQPATPNRPRLARPPAALLAVGAAIGWATWSTLGDMSQRWTEDPTYSHGFLVPLIALAILWTRRRTRPAAAERPSWWALAPVALGAAMQLVGAYLSVAWLCGAALLAYAAGLALLVGGRPMLRWAAPAIGFLVFMIPLPWRIETIMRNPLQRLSTLASAYVLQTLGRPVFAEGNIIVVSDTIELGIIDACSGLKMLVIFFAMATAIAMLPPAKTGRPGAPTERPWVDRVLIVLSALPIAMITNIARITATGILHEAVGSKWANLVFHDLAGWLMMPMALALLWCELQILSALLVAEEAPARRLAPLLIEAGVPVATPAGTLPVGVAGGRRRRSGRR